MLNDAAQRFLDVALSGERRRVFQLVEELQAEGLGLASLYLDIFQPALRELGRLWEINQISVGQEHLVTAITQACMARLYGDSLGVTDAGPTLIAACTQSEQHEVGLRMICDLLEHSGWETIYLGAAVPFDSLAVMVEARMPQVVALSAATLPHVAQLEEAITGLRASASQPFLIAVGGRPFLERPELARRIGADLTAVDAAELVTQLNGRFAGYRRPAGA